MSTLPLRGLDLEQYKTQAKNLLKQAKLGLPEAFSRFKSDHPEGDTVFRQSKILLADSQLVVARENGFGSWATFKEYILFLQAVAALDSGDVPALSRLLDANPRLVHYHCRRGEYESGYFAGATLLHHIAGNPVRCPLPSNIMEIARLLLERGADPNAASNPATSIGLLMTSRQASEAGVAVPLIDLLSEAGASDSPDLNNPQTLDDPIWNVGIETAKALVARGAKMDLPQAAALGQIDALKKLADEYARDKDMIEIALIYACAQNQLQCANFLVNLGAKGDVVPPAEKRGSRKSTALHNAAWRGNEDIVKLLMDRGCDAAVRDHHWNGTPADWARHGGYPKLSDMLESYAAKKGSK